MRVALRESLFHCLVVCLGWYVHGGKEITLRRGIFISDPMTEMKAEQKAKKAGAVKINNTQSAFAYILAINIADKDVGFLVGGGQTYPPFRSDACRQNRGTIGWTRCPFRWRSHCYVAKPLGNRSDQQGVSPYLNRTGYRGPPALRNRQLLVHLGPLIH
jgi:hypothetical protein